MKSLTFCLLPCYGIFFDNRFTEMFLELPSDSHMNFVQHIALIGCYGNREPNFQVSHCAYSSEYCGAWASVFPLDKLDTMHILICVSLRNHY